MFMAHRIIIEYKRWFGKIVIPVRPVRPKVRYLKEKLIISCKNNLKLYIMCLTIFLSIINFVVIHVAFDGSYHGYMCSGG